MNFYEGSGPEKARQNPDRTLGENYSIKVAMSARNAFEYTWNDYLIVNALSKALLIEKVKRRTLQSVAPVKHIVFLLSFDI